MFVRALRPKAWGPAVLGGTVSALAILFAASGAHLWVLIAGLMGASLLFWGYRPGRAGQVLFGHASIITGCMMVAAGIYYIPYVKPLPDLRYVLGQPLFWGLFAILGGFCANYHGFCACVTRGRPEQPD